MSKLSERLKKVNEVNYSANNAAMIPESWIAEIEALEADATLGALVRRMPEGRKLAHLRENQRYNDDLHWSFEDPKEGTSDGATPEEALRKGFGEI